MTKHNGIEYKQEQVCDVIRYDGGAMGGVITRYPSDMCHAKEIGWHDTFAKAADAMQIMQRKRYEECREFVIQYEKEAEG